MKQLEKVIELRTVRWAEARGILVTKLNLMGHRGMPDRCFWLPGGSPVLIEFKRKGAKPTKLQEYTIEKLRSLGYQVHVCDEAGDAFSRIIGAMETASAPLKGAALSPRARRGRSATGSRTRQD